MLVAGETLQDRYACEERLGAGGQGNVYSATDNRLAGKRWAIKELQQPDSAVTDRLRQQFEQEAQVLAHLDHPGLPKVVDYFTERNQCYLVMDLILGEDLDARLNKAGGPLPEATVVDIGRQLCTILEYLHSRRPHAVLHRDIKPANVKLTPDGQVKLVDFGLAKVAALGDPSRTAIRGSGTPGFAPLEQYGQQGGTDARSDLYALGSCLYFLATATAPPEAPDRAAKTRPLRPVRSINPGVTPELAATIERAMAMRPDDRFPSAAAMRSALDRTGELHARAGNHCLRCGTPLAIGQKFCPRCGATAGVVQSLPRAALFALTGAVIGVGLAWLPLLALASRAGDVLTTSLVGSAVLACEGAATGVLLGYRVPPGRAMYLNQAIRLLIAALTGQLLLLAIAVALSRGGALVLPRELAGVGIAGAGAFLGAVALLAAPGVRRAWPR